jgi:hypothetical protein
MASVTVVIPSFSSARAASLAALRRALAGQTLSDHEVIVVAGVSPQGKAINQGAATARGEWLVIVDDDSAIRDPRLLEKLIATLAADPTIGMAGASVRTPDDATWLQRWAAREFPRFQVPIVDRVTDSDLACHGCAAFPLAVFRAAGAEREDIVRGLDPDLRQRLRQRGYRVVLVPDAAVFHPLPPTLFAFLRTFVRNGNGSARSQLTDPACVFETAEEVGIAGFVPRRPLGYRIARFPLRILHALVRFQFLRALAYAAYALGYGMALVGAARRRR